MAQWYRTRVLRRLVAMVRTALLLRAARRCLAIWVLRPRWWMRARCTRAVHMEAWPRHWCVQEGGSGAVGRSRGGHMCNGASANIGRALGVTLPLVPRVMSVIPLLPLSPL